MKNFGKLFALVGLLAAVCCMVAGCGGRSSETVVTPPAEQSALVESAHEIPEETLNTIRRELRGYFYNFDDNSIIVLCFSRGGNDTRKSGKRIRGILSTVAPITVFSVIVPRHSSEKK